MVDPTQSALSPTALLGQLRADFNEPEVVAYLPDNAIAAARECLRSDYGGIVSRTRPIGHLASAVDIVQSDGFYLDDTFGNPGDARDDTIPSGMDGLSGREREIMAAVARGDSCKAIARILNVSPKTVETHKARAMSKLGLTSRSGVIVHGLENRWHA